MVSKKSKKSFGKSTGIVSTQPVKKKPSNSRNRLISTKPIKNPKPRDRLVTTQPVKTKPSNPVVEQQKREQEPEIRHPSIYRPGFINEDILKREQEPEKRNPSIYRPGFINEDILKREQEPEKRNPSIYRPGFTNKKRGDSLIVDGNFRDNNGCIKGQESYNIETKQCEKLQVEYRMNNLNQNTDIISEEKNFINDYQIDEKLIDSELNVNDELEIVDIDNNVNNYKSAVLNPDSSIKVPETVESKVPETVESKVPETVESKVPETEESKVTKTDVYNCNPNGNPPTFYCENSGKCENLNSYNFKNNLCGKENKEKYDDDKQNYYFKIAILIIVVLIIIIGMVYFLNKD